MVFKYQHALNEVSAGGTQCPPVGSSPAHIKAYRWTKNPVSTNCFLPVAVRNPPRLHRERDATKVCSCWGLSMHNSEGASKNAFLCVEGFFRNARKTLGGWISEGTILPSHGSCTVANSAGHFDLHEDHPSSVANAFVPVVQIPPAP
jgi:hypothetical protein